MFDIITLLQSDKEYQETMLQRYRAELESLPQGILCTKERKGKMYYYQMLKEDGKWKQKYIPFQQKELVEQLKLQRFFKESEKIFKGNIKAIDQLLRTYRDYDPNIIEQQLPKAYRPLPQRGFLDTGKPRVEDWENESYKQNDKYSKKKIHLTPGGQAVQSKAEAIIASQLEANGIPYRYDSELRLGNHTIHPDFAMLDVRRNIPVYWEHFGMLDEENYFDSMPWKLKLYQQHGITIFDRLIITSDAPDGSFNGQIVSDIIKLFFLSGK